MNASNGIRRYGVIGFIFLAVGFFFRFFAFRGATSFSPFGQTSDVNISQRAADAQAYAEIGLVFLILGPSLIFLSALFDLVRKSRE